MHLIQNQDTANKINTLEVDKSSVFIDKAKTGKIRPWQERKSDSVSEFGRAPVEG